MLIRVWLPPSAIMRLEETEGADGAESPVAAGEARRVDTCANCGGSVVSSRSGMMSFLNGAGSGPGPGGTGFTRSGYSVAMAARSVGFATCVSMTRWKRVHGLKMQLSL